MLNRMAVDLTRRPTLDPDDVTWVRTSLERKVGDEPDFNGLVSVINLRVYEAISTKRFDADLDGILDDYQDLHRRQSDRSWRSAYDQMSFVLPRCDLARSGELLEFLRDPSKGRRGPEGGQRIERTSFRRSPERR
jgi:hypothetical protein